MEGCELVLFEGSKYKKETVYTTTSDDVAYESDTESEPEMDKCSTAGSTISVIKVETLKDTLEPMIYASIKKMEDKYLKTISKQEEEIKRLTATVVKPAPCPTPPGKVVKLEDLRKYVTSLDTYHKMYLQAESMGDTKLRIKMHALLVIIDNFVKTEGDMRVSDKKYYKEAIAKIPIMVNNFITAANKANKPLALWINENVNHK